MDVSLVLASARNYPEFKEFVGVIESVDWPLVPDSQSSRGNHARYREFSPGRAGPGETLFGTIAGEAVNHYRGGGNITQQTLGSELLPANTVYRGTIGETWDFRRSW